MSVSGYQPKVKTNGSEGLSPPQGGSGVLEPPLCLQEGAPPGDKKKIAATSYLSAFIRAHLSQQRSQTTGKQLAEIPSKEALNECIETLRIILG